MNNQNNGYYYPNNQGNYVTYSLGRPPVYVVPAKKSSWRIVAIIAFVIAFCAIVQYLRSDPEDIVCTKSHSTHDEEVRFTYYRNNLQQIHVTETFETGSSNLSYQKSLVEMVANQNYGNMKGVTYDVKIKGTAIAVIVTINYDELDEATKEKLHLTGNFQGTQEKAKEIYEENGYSCQ